MANKRRKGGKIGRPPKIIVNTDGIEASLPVKYIRKCGRCSKKIVDDEGVLTWETMEFCNNTCLEMFQNEIGSKCTNCNSNVRPLRLGKLCVRIGYKISQFCNAACLSEYRAEAKVCARCHKDITRDESAIFTDVGEGDCKDFCSETCKNKHIANTNRQNFTNGSCATCNRQTISIELEHGDKVVLFCGHVCYSAYKYSLNLASNQCKSCHKYFENKILEENSMYYKGDICTLCSPACKNRYINLEKKIMKCKTCNIQKYSFDLISLNDSDPAVMMCSLKCLSNYNSSKSSKSSNTSTPTPNLNNIQAPKDSTIKKVMPFLSKQTENRNSTPSSVTEFRNSNTSTPISKSVASTPGIEELEPLPEIKVPNLPGPPRNVATMCKINVESRHTSTEVTTNTIGVQKECETRSIEVQTDLTSSAVLPIPIPISVPVPMMMYSAPYPVPFPFPVPLPVPIFIPTGKRTYQGVTKRIKKILDRSLKDPLQDEMLMLAEMVSKENNAVSSSESESEPEPEKAKSVAKPVKGNQRGGKRVAFRNNVNNRAPPRRARFSKQNVSYVDYDNDAAEAILTAPKRTNKRVSFHNDFENDIQPKNNRRVMFAEDQNNTDGMGHFYNTNMQQPTLDDEISDGGDNDLQPYDSGGYSTPYSQPQTPRNLINDFDEREDFVKRRQKRQGSPGRSSGPNKRGRPNYTPKSVSPIAHTTYPPTPAPVPPPTTPKPLPPLHEVFKKPDNEMHLKYSLGVSAWQQWLEAKHPGRFNPDILKLSCEELDTSLCLFINEVQKPNGQIYTPDTIYYFCLGIQQHLFLNGRTDNIFYNLNYKRFTDCLDEIAKKFLVLYNDADFIVTRIEEEHLWESKQLGAHSPQVLLNTLLFFNTKHFNLTMVEEHKSLWFSHIVKSAKYTNGKSGRTRTVVLRYYPNGKDPQQQGKARKKKGFEQFENEENPLRCPIRLYEFYISKCPENIKLSNECFYLLPESSCLPESSVWYSTTTVPDYEIDKVLNRFKIVREITMALLAK